MTDLRDTHQRPRARMMRPSSWKEHSVATTPRQLAARGRAARILAVLQPSPSSLVSSPRTSACGSRPTGRSTAEAERVERSRLADGVGPRSGAPGHPCARTGRDCRHLVLHPARHRLGAVRRRAPARRRGDAGRGRRLQGRHRQRAERGRAGNRLPPGPARNRARRGLAGAAARLQGPDGGRGSEHGRRQRDRGARPPRRRRPQGERLPTSSPTRARPARSSPSRRRRLAGGEGLGREAQRLEGHGVRPGAERRRVDSGRRDRPARGGRTRAPTSSMSLDGSAGTVVAQHPGGRQGQARIGRAARTSRAAHERVGRRRASTEPAPPEPTCTEARSVTGAPAPARLPSRGRCPASVDDRWAMPVDPLLVLPSEFDRPSRCDTTTGSCRRAHSSGRAAPADETKAHQPLERTTMGIIAFIILGLLAGIIAKAILPGSDPAA